jgi:hypothetical protein
MSTTQRPDSELVYFLFHREPLGDSRINAGAQVWRLHWYCAHDGTHWITDVDTSMNNWRRSNWAEIVHHPQPWGMYRNLRRVNTRTTRIFDDPVISADSRWVLEQRLTLEALADAIAQLEAHYHAPRPTVMSTLFEVES